MGSAVCAQEELRASACRGGKHRTSMLFPFQDRQAEGVRLQSTLNIEEAGYLILQCYYR